MASAVAVAYLYCRILDTYEDLLPTLEEKQRALRGFIDRFASEVPGPAESLSEEITDDPRESTHVLLVNRAEWIDRSFLSLSPGQQQAIRHLVQRMGEGMIWSSRVFAEQRGSLRDPGQLSRYCWNVLGNPILFAEQVQRLDQGAGVHVPEDRLRICADVGEFVQLANVTRDLEKDLARGVFYHPELFDPRSGEGRPERIREVRWQLILRALRKSGAMRPFVVGMPSRPVSLARGAAFLLMLTTYAYYVGASRRAEAPWSRDEDRVGRLRGAWMFLRVVGSRRATERILAGLQERLDRSWNEGAERHPLPFVSDDQGFEPSVAGG